MYIDNMYVEQYVSGSCQTLNSTLCKRHKPNASNSRGQSGLTRVVTNTKKIGVNDQTAVKQYFTTYSPDPFPKIKCVSAKV